MGSRQKADKAFLFAVCDDAMLDRWMPDEDWVCQFEMQQRLLHFEFEHGNVKAVFVAKGPCHSTRNDNFLQQEECPNLEGQI
jgi:hypothetical protein